MRSLTTRRGEGAAPFARHVALSEENETSKNSAPAAARQFEISMREKARDCRRWQRSLRQVLTQGLSRLRVPIQNSVRN